MEHLDCIEELHAARALLGAIAREFVGELGAPAKTLDGKVRAVIYELLALREEAAHYKQLYWETQDAQRDFVLGLIERLENSSDPA